MVKQKEGVAHRFAFTYDTLTMSFLAAQRIDSMPAKHSKLQLSKA